MPFEFTIDGQEARPIPGWPEYAATADGFIWSCKTKNGQGVTGWHKLSAPIRGAYRSLGLFDKGRKRSAVRVHVLVLEAFVGPRPGRADSRHLNDDKLDNRACNLAWGTRADNLADGLKNGRRRCGERHHQAKLTAEKVAAMRAMRASGRTLLSIASEFGVCSDTATKAIKGETWAHV